jgi:hypothetical protein
LLFFTSCPEVLLPEDAGDGEDVADLLEIHDAVVVEMDAARAAVIKGGGGVARAAFRRIPGVQFTNV